MASLRLACDRNRAKKETDFINVICWEKQAETVANNLQKGRLVYVEGQLQIRVWEDQEKKRRETPEIHASKIQFLDFKAKDPNEDPLNAQMQELGTELPA